MAKCSFFQTNVDTSVGCLLICDYGHDQAKSKTIVNRDTFRAYRNHKQCDPLVDPGLADLTADVDFASIRARLTGKCNVFGTATQRHFLTQLGIGLRLKVFFPVSKRIILQFVFISEITSGH